MWQRATLAGAAGGRSADTPSGYTASPRSCTPSFCSAATATAPTSHTRPWGAPTHRSSGPESEEIGRGTTGAATHSGGRPRAKKAPIAAWLAREQILALVPGSVAGRSRSVRPRLHLFTSSVGPRSWKNGDAGGGHGCAMRGRRDEGRGRWLWASAEAKKRHAALESHMVWSQLDLAARGGGRGAFIG